MRLRTLNEHKQSHRLFQDNLDHIHEDQQEPEPEPEGTTDGGTLRAMRACMPGMREMRGLLPGA
jgi:hypothetical protein